MPPDLRPELLGKFAELPPELLREVFKALPPEGLQAFRETSTALKDTVDQYVAELIQRRELRDLQNRPVQGADADPWKALAEWAEGRYQTDLWSSQLHPITPEGVLRKYEAFFLVDEAPDTEWQQNTMAIFDNLMLFGGERALRVRAELETLARQMALTGQVTMTADKTIVDPTTSTATILDGIRGGTMLFTRPPTG